MRKTLPDSAIVANYRAMFISRNGRDCVLSNVQIAKIYDNCPVFSTPQEDDEEILETMLEEEQG